MLSLGCFQRCYFVAINLHRTPQLNNFPFHFSSRYRKYSTPFQFDLFDGKKMSYEEVEKLLEEHAVGAEVEITKQPRVKRVFRDWAKVRVKAGNGGNGVVSFLRARNKRVGPPSGGDGGAGGDIIFRAVDTELNLAHLQHSYRAENGEHGQGNNKAGRSGAHTYIDVPVGCLITEYKPLPNARDEDKISEIWDDPTLSKREKLNKLFEKDHQTLDFTSSPNPKKKQIINLGLKQVMCRLGTGISLDQVGAYFVAARGGRGGYGNAHFVSGKNRSPKQATPGTCGEEKHYLIELKLIADIGLVGYPNAGKSSLLAALSRAAPKIAAYPFTTLQPQLGTIEYQDRYQITVTDLPGIIEFAHKNRGLGLDFLRHIERTKVLAFVVDMAGTEGRDPWNDFMVVRRELELYQKDLLRRISVIIANKMDLPEAKAKLRKFRQRLYESPDVSHIPVYAVSAKTGLDIDELKDALRDIITEAYEKNNPEYSNRKPFYAVDLTPQFNAALRQTSVENESDTKNKIYSGKTELELRKQTIPKEKTKKHKSKKKSQ